MKVNFRCTDCRQKYSFNAEPGEEIHFRCRQCGAVQTVIVPEAPEEPETAPLPPSEPAVLPPPS